MFLEKHVCVGRFCDEWLKLSVKLRKFCTETFHMIQNAYKREVLSRSRCHDWFKRFKENQPSSRNRSGQPSTSTNECHVARLNKLAVVSSINYITEECKFSFESSRGVLTKKIGNESCCSKVCSPVHDGILKITSGWSLRESSR